MEVTERISMFIGRGAGLQHDLKFLRLCWEPTPGVLSLLIETCPP